MSFTLRYSLQPVVNFLLPPRCLGCRVEVDHQGVLCSPCWAELDFITDPQCQLCGFPFEFEHGGEALCAICTRESPIYDRARSVVTYNEASKGLILSFKHGDAIHGAPTYAQWMARAGRDLIKQADAIVPVPLHWRRLFMRQYNQAAVLGNALSKLTGIHSLNNVLVRSRATPSQGYRKRPDRVKNVKGAFKVSEKGQKLLRDKRVVLVDDVYTTGATVEECARTLKSAGVKTVDALTFARVTYSRVI